MNEDMELLRRYVENNANEAFSELVQRHINMVYSAALRQVNGDAHLAADATQLVFTDLARKAQSLVGHRVLAGWLFTSTRYTTAKLIRGERRRHARETEAQLMQEINRDGSAEQPLDWQRVRPVLDDVIGALSNEDREAILLRFFDGQDYASVGAKLNLADNTARMRVERALDKLRRLLQRRGVQSTSSALAVALAHQAVGAAPAGLAAAVAGSALAGATIAGIGNAATAGVGGAGAVMKFMSTMKLQLGLGSALVVAGVSGYLLEANANAKLREQAARLRADNLNVTALQAENLRLGRLAVEVGEMRQDDAEFERLEREAGTLKTRLQELARAEEIRRKARSAQVMNSSMLDQTPVARFQARPLYPFEMRRAGITGEVVVDFVVDTNGDVVDAYPLRSSRKEFEMAAVLAISKWKFKPGRKDGRDVLTHLQVPVVFSLEDQRRTSAALPLTKSDTERTNPSDEPTRVKLSDFHVVGTAAKPTDSTPAPPRE